MTTQRRRSHRYSRLTNNNQPRLHLRVVTESGELRYARSTLDAIGRELRHLIGKQLFRSDLTLSRLSNRGEVTRGNGSSIDPLGNSPLGNTDRLGQLLLASSNRDGALDSFHAQKISAAYVQTQQRRWWPAGGPSISVANVLNQDGKKAKPTPADREAAKRLKNAWLGIPRALRPTQEKLGERWGEGGGQSLISQYMSGRIPLNIRAMLFFARELGVDPREIYPDLPGVDLAIVERQGSEEDELDREWRSYPREVKQQIIETIRKIQGTTKTTAPTPNARPQKRARRPV